HPGDDARPRGRADERNREVRRHHRRVLGNMRRFVAVAALSMSLVVSGANRTSAQTASSDAAKSPVVSGFGRTKTQRKEDVNRRNPDGSTPLQWAVFKGDVAEARRLLRAGADVSLANNYGATPMSLAAEVGNTDMLKVLLEVGADADSPNPDGQTALQAVARTGNVEAAQLLLSRGATVDAREKWGGQTALMW